MGKTPSESWKKIWICRNKWVCCLEFSYLKKETLLTQLYIGKNTHSFYYNNLCKKAKTTLMIRSTVNTAEVHEAKNSILFASLTTDCKSRCRMTIVAYCPSKKKHGNAFTITKPDEKIVIYLEKSTSESGQFDCKTEYFGIQFETVIVRYMSAGWPRKSTLFSFFRLISTI